MPKRKIYKSETIHPLVNSKRKASQEEEEGGSSSINGPYSSSSLHDSHIYFLPADTTKRFQLWSVVVTKVFDSFYIVPTCERSDVIVQRLNSSLASSTSISCTTFNILAPIYKRIDQLVCLFVCSLLLPPHVFLIFRNFLTRRHGFCCVYRIRAIERAILATFGILGTRIY